MNNIKNVYVDLHVIQTVPPSCVNRDDTGSPKTAMYGGTMRARVSSQAWKRAIRLRFRQTLSEEDIGQRTKLVTALIAEQLMQLRPDYAEKKAQTLAKKVLEAAGVKVKDKEEKTDALFFISPKQVHALAEIAAGQETEKFDKAQCLKALNDQPSVDLALFGRMVAAEPQLNFDAAAQVAHAISTHAVENEFDFFTAVDDCAPEDNTGAGHLGTVEFNSATLYRYATVNVSELERALAEQTPSAVRAFAEAFIRSMPTGRQNTFANGTRADAVYVTVRGDQPINMAGAFEEPVSSEGHGYVKGSVKRLVQYAEETYQDFAAAPLLALTSGKGLEELAEPGPVDALLDRLEACLQGNGEER